MMRKKRYRDTLDQPCDVDSESEGECDDDSDYFELSPHCGHAALPRYTEESLSRYLLDDAPRLRYRRRVCEVRSSLHWGQRKLLLSEIEFLSRFTGNMDDITVVYAGAAPGHHIPLLSKLFSKVKFVLIDPREIAVKETQVISIRNGLMTNEVAREFHGNKILFISDIRSADFRELSSDELEAAIKQDMTDQMHWHQIMQPRASMLKFRLPWDDECSSYLLGDICLPIWGPQSTTETRLIVESNSTTSDSLVCTYDHKKYCEQMFYFNNYTRICKYNHDIREIDLDQCYDCCAEVVVLKSYLSKMHTFHSTEPLDPWINDLLNETNIVEKTTILSRWITFQLSNGNRSLQSAPRRRYDDNFSIPRKNEQYFNASMKALILLADIYSSEGKREITSIPYNAIEAMFINRDFHIPHRPNVTNFHKINVQSLLLEQGEFGGNKIDCGSGLNLYLWALIGKVALNTCHVPEICERIAAFNSLTDCELLDTTESIDDIHGVLIIHSNGDAYFVYSDEQTIKFYLPLQLPHFPALLAVTLKGCFSNPYRKVLEISKICYVNQTIIDRKSDIKECLDKVENTFELTTSLELEGITEITVRDNEE